MQKLLPITLATALSGISFPSYTQPEPERSEIQQLQELPPHDLTDILDTRHGFILFSIDGCPACRRAHPRFQALEQEAEAACISSDALDFDYVNLSHERPEPSDFIREEMQYVPTIIEVQNGRDVHHYVGAGEEFGLFEARVRHFIQQYR
ncbi:MAG TPA: thioredoxin family protein [Candidatus Nanoarchaeia archaeon]|nr:thioredoxin family protein [Candidatus Nanoarchaeia archaeon]